MWIHVQCGRVWAWFEPLWVCLFLLLPFCLPCVHAEGIQCGRPGRPVNGTVSTSGRFYFPGERVAYKCLEGFVLFGAEERTCLKNGTWSDSVPFCDFNLARGKRALQSATLWSYVPDMAVDGNSDTCSFTPRGPDPRWWQVHLGHKFNVITVGVTISPGSMQEFTIYVIELLTDNKALYKPCTTFKGVFETRKSLFHCNDGLGHPGQFVYIRDDRKDQEYFGLCEVEVFAFRERIPCGEPEVPVEGEVEREGEGVAKYLCRPGFRLEGDETLTCSSKGKWQGQSPKCKESQCPTPGQVSNGFMEVANFRGVYGHGTVITYTCSPGYKLQGTATLICQDDGVWNHNPPQCKAVTCEAPPVFPNARHILLNSSTSWNGIAVYTCTDGYRLDTHTKDTVTACQENGEWSIINITCIPVPLPSSPLAGLRNGEGRALSFDLEEISPGETKSTRGLVVALAILAGVLTTAMMVVGVLLARRYLSSTSGSLRSLLKSNTNELTGNSGVSAGSHLSTTSSDTLSSGTLPSRDAEDPTTDDTRPSSYHQNILPVLPNIQMTSISESEIDEDSNYAQIAGGGGGGRDPPYERVRNQLEHSYETLRKKFTGSDGDSSDEEMRREEKQDKESDGYESVCKEREPSYEAVEQDHEYETLKNKDPGYEVVLSQEHCYETVPERVPPPHSYETLKPRPPPPRETLTFPLEGKSVPDILQDLTSTGENIPPEIQVLYARVDMSKKKSRRPQQTKEVDEGQDSAGSPPQSPPTSSSSSSGPPIVTKDFIQKREETGYQHDK